MTVLLVLVWGCTRQFGKELQILSFNYFKHISFPLTQEKRIGHGKIVASAFSHLIVAIQLINWYPAIAALKM